MPVEAPERSEGQASSNVQRAKAPRIQRRKSSRQPRPVLSCQRCRQQRVRCDRGTPCEKCISSQAEDECRYSNNVTSEEWRYAGISLSHRHAALETVASGKSGRFDGIPSSPSAESASASETLVSQQTRPEDGDAEDEPKPLVGLWTDPSSARRGSTHWLPLLHHVRMVFRFFLTERKEKVLDHKNHVEILMCC